MIEDLMATTVAIILAGGRSSRMGQDKALICLREKPFLYQICTVAQKCASQVYVITPWIEKYQAIVPLGCHLIREESLVTTDNVGNGPLVGFVEGLKQVSFDTEWILLLACDLPQLKATEINQWYKYLAQVPKEAIALLPRHAKGWEPLSGFYRRCCLPLLQEYIKGGGRSFQVWLAQQKVIELPISDRQLLFNCNTLEDLEKVKSQKSKVKSNK